MSLQACYELAEADAAERQARKARARADSGGREVHELDGMDVEAAIPVYGSPAKRAQAPRNNHGELRPIAELLGSYKSTPSMVFAEDPASHVR